MLWRIVSVTSDAIPFTVIGGFLGAGKTTLLNRLLRGATNRRFAVLVNDFGALDILARDGVIVVVDAAEVRERAADRRVGDTVTRQLGAADLLVLNKVDLANDLTGLRDWLSTQSAAPVLEARHADVPLDLLFGLDRYGGPAGCGATDGFASWSYEWPEPVERETVLAMLRDAAGVLRAKGIVRFADAPARRSVVHLVGHRLDVSDGGPWNDNAASRLVLLGVKPMLRLPI
jgi:G3E family GTPase